MSAFKHLSLFIQKAKGRPPEAIKPPYTRKDQVSGPRVHKGRKDPSLLKHYLLLCDLGSHQQCFLRCFVPRFVRGWNGFFERLVQIWQRWSISTHILWIWNPEINVKQLSRPRATSGKTESSNYTHSATMQNWNQPNWKLCNFGDKASNANLNFKLKLY